MGGRPRKPVQEHILSGTSKNNSYRKNWNTRNDRPLTSKPAPGKFLKRTQIAWNQFMDVKAAQGVLSAEDEVCIMAMFESLDKYIRLSDKEYEILTSDDPDLDELAKLERPLHKHQEEFRAWAVKYGVTPAERSKLVVSPQKEESPMMQLIQKVKEG